MLASLDAGSLATGRQIGYALDRDAARGQASGPLAKLIKTLH